MTDWQTYRNAPCGSLGIWNGWRDIAPPSASNFGSTHVVSGFLIGTVRGDLFTARGWS